ncbi:MAG TPA: tetratricopeptide repeat protein, partial [Planctomycetaceae bacterium]|nr:tetratricopeptide repeat protein [Planctomycetaceae bacterium]
ESWQEAYEYCRKAVEAGRRAIGDEYPNLVGDFWHNHTTRPYMRAMLALADCLIAGRRQDEAIELFEEMLRLNPEDNQGVRYRLASLLLEEGRDADLKELLDRYQDEESTFWDYSRAILAFRTEGDTEATRRLLERALERDPHVPEYLLDPNRLPTSQSDYFAPGPQSDAKVYAARSVAGWRSTPGAIGWLRKHVSRQGDDGQGEGPERPDPATLLSQAWQLPQEHHEIWQFDVRRASEVFPENDPRHGKWIVLISNVTDDTIHHVDFLAERPKPTAVWTILLEAMLDPIDGDARRPGRIELRRKTFWKSWRWRLETLNIECALVEDLDHVDRISEVVQERMAAETLRFETEEDLQRIAELPQDSEAVWQVGVIPLPTWLNDRGEMRQPWIVLVVEAGRGLVLHQGMEREEPSADFIARTLFQAMLVPADHHPRRPHCVLVRNNDHRIALAPTLERVGVECFVADSTPELDEAVECLAACVSDDENRPALIEIPGIRRQQVASFFEAGAQFYRAQPWRRVPADTVLRVDFDDGNPAPWYGVIIGQAGVSLGLAVYEDPDSLRTLFHTTDEEVALERMEALSMNFGEEFELPFADLEAAEQFGWTIAAPEAYPYLFRVAPGYQVQSPSVQDVIRMDACMRALPQFIASHKERAVISVPLPAEDRPLNVTLQWKRDFF